MGSREGGRDQGDAPSLHKTGPSPLLAPNKPHHFSTVDSTTLSMLGGHSWFLFILSVFASAPQHFGLEQTLVVLC